MTTTLRQFVEHAANQAERIFKRRGELLPMYHAIDGAGKDLIFPSPSANKDLAVTIVREILKNAGAIRVAYLDEAWTLDQEKNADVDIEQIYRAGGSISKHPARIEAVIISGEDAIEGMVMATREIIRHGNKAMLGKLKFMDGGSMEGRMVGLLPAPDQKH